MEDQVLSSMCKEPVSYYTLAEQREGFTQHESRQREVCLQRAIDSSYRSVCWNYSSSHHCTLDHPTNTDIEQCITIAKSRFQAYTESHVEAHQLASQSNSINSHNALDGRRCSVNHALPSSFSLKRKAGTGPNEKLITAPPPKTQRISKVEKNEQLVQSTALWLKDELEKLSVKTFPTLITLSDISPSQPKDEACTLADHLWKLSDEVENESAAVVWSMRYIATCASVVGTVFTSPSKVVMDLGVSSTLLSEDKVSRHTIRNWQGLVRIVNTIVNMMLLKWENKAYLIFHVFAVKGHLLSGVARMSDARREIFASGVANALGLIAPSGFEGVPLFNPTRVLSGMLPNKSHEEICKAIWLPSAINSGTIEAERSILHIPNMATLSRRVKDLSALPAQVRSGNISSTPSLSPPPTPPTFQQAHFTGTGENMERCNTDKIHQSSTTTNIGANLAQVGDLPPSYLTCGAVSLAQVDAAGTILQENPMLNTNMHEGTRPPSPVLNLDSDYGFDGSAFENSEFFGPLFNISNEAFDGGT
ncbi:hypothetical protein IFR04_015687 [Cadophora malorum]|uniref:Uncharacterized protein n=1 Tax=Cadophora malorum TaxID=108018 RepID=A0A8H7VZ83_9HELO|nr:hypothetical protein IFR04_015687 [Cadophora malorum]